MFFPKPIKMPSHMRRFAKDSNMCCQNLPRQICKKASLGKKSRHGQVGNAAMANKL